MLKSQIESFITENRKGKKRPCFGVSDEFLSGYINWAFTRDYLILSSDKNGINGVAIAYPLPNKFNGDIKTLMPFDDTITFESDKDICILDWIASSVDGRVSLVFQFMQRFKNWQAQDKYGIQYGIVKKLPNKYIKLLTLNNN